MAINYRSHVKETTTTTGTGTINLDGAVTGYKSFVGAGLGGQVVTYYIEHQSANEWEEGIGTVTDATPDTLSRTTVLRSSNSDASVTFSSGTKNVTCVQTFEVISEKPWLCNGRLTLESGVPISLTDQTAKTTLYWAPYLGNKVSLYVNGIWRDYTFSELSIAVPSAVFRIYDVFVYDNAGTLTLELIAWDSGGQTTGTITGLTNATPCVATSAGHGRSVGDLVGINGVGGNTACNGKIWYLSNTTTTFTCEGSVGNGAFSSNGTWYLIPTARTTAISTQDGVYVKDSDKTRRYLGTFMTTNTSGQTEDSAKRRFVWNMYNRVQRSLECFDTTNTWNYTTAAWRAINAGTDMGTGQVAVVIGLREDNAVFSILAFGANATNTNAANAGVGINRTAANSARLVGYEARASMSFHAWGRYSGILPLGFSFVSALEYGGTTVTFYGDAGTAHNQTGMSGEVFA